MPAPGLPEYLDPVIGFIQWHLSRHDSLENATEKARANADYSWASAPEIDAAARQAQVNYRNSAALNLPFALRVPIREVLSQDTADATIGLRAVVKIRFPDGHTEDASVVLNVRSNIARRTIDNAVAQWVNSGGMSARSIGRGGRAYPVEAVGTPEYIVVAGGVDNPAITL